MQSTKSGFACFPPAKRHAYLDADSVKRLVRGIQAGLDYPANLERTRDGWRLRVTIGQADGGKVRRSITLPDRATAEWVADYLGKARMEAAKRRFTEQVSRDDKRPGATGDQT